jgi:hypothetical protein
MLCNVFFQVPHGIANGSLAETDEGHLTAVGQCPKGSLANVQEFCSLLGSKQEAFGLVVH